MITRLENHFGKILAWSLIYFLNYAYFDIYPSPNNYGTPSSYWTKGTWAIYFRSLHYEKPCILSIFLSKAHRSWSLYREGSASPLTAGWAPTRPLGPPLVPTIIKAPKIRWSIVQPREWSLQGAPPSPASIWCNNKGLKPKRLSRGKLCQLVGFQVRSKTV